jgi:peptidoglycan/xylan/chitin deacetylase (PgdA/CDA1 family)
LTAVSKLFCFRFDVDTHRCARMGMPALSALGARMDAPFTFFVNMGRAVSPPLSLRRLLSPAGGTAEAAKYSPRVKLGWRGFLEAAILNPRVGAGAKRIVRDAHRAGHEIGLHGGRNHATWQRESHGWSQGRFEREVDAVLPALADVLGGRGPVGFASPGWATSGHLAPLLSARGFRYLADLHGPDPASEESGGHASPLPLLRTHLTGEPGGVAYLEHLRALGLGDAEVLRRFERDLERVGPTAVAYDHPCFAGTRELPMIERMIRVVRALGYEVVPLATIAGQGS